MARSLLVNIFDTVFGSLWGLALIDMFSLSVFTSIDNWIKVSMAFAGLVYFLISIPYKIKNNNLDIEIKEEELEKIRAENELIVKSD